MSDNLHTIVTALSDEIAKNLNSLSSEGHHPSRNADDSDDYMKKMRERVIQLRQARDTVENIMTDVTYETAFPGMPQASPAFKTLQIEGMP